MGTLEIRENEEKLMGSCYNTSCLTKLSPREEELIFNSIAVHPLLN